MSRENISVGRPPFLGGGSWNMHNLNQINVLLGKNGSGKSILLRGIQQDNPAESHYIVPERAGNINFDSGLLAEEIHSSSRNLRSNRNHVGNYRQKVIARIQAYFLTRGSSRGEAQLRGDPEVLENLISNITTDFSIFLNGASNPPYSIIRNTDNQPINDIEQLSSGESQLITLGLDILTISAIWDLQNTPNRIILIDEPDAHLHSDLQVRLANFIFQVSEKFKVQFIIATHSTPLLAGLGVMGGSKTSVIHLSNNNSPLTAKKFDNYLTELATILGGNILMGPLFGSPLLLVEGDDDYMVWSQVPRYNITHFSVIPCGGQAINKYRLTLEKTFNSISSEGIKGFALIDGDKSLPNHTPENPQNYIKFIRLNCRECENLYLTEEVLQDLGLSWAEAQIKIRAELSKYPTEIQSKINDLLQNDKRLFDLKNIIHPLSEILDSKKITWTIRVGKAIGKNIPTGELRTFLGEQVCNAIWH